MKRMNRPAPKRRRESDAKTLWELTLMALTAVAFVALFLLAMASPGNRTVEATISPPAADYGPAINNQFEDLPATPAEVIEAKRRAQEIFDEAWRPKTVARTSRNAAWIAGLEDCDKDCQRIQARLDKRDAHDFIHRYADGGRHYRRELDGISDGSGQVKYYGDRIERDRRNNR